MIGPTTARAIVGGLVLGATAIVLTVEGLSVTAALIEVAVFAWGIGAWSLAPRLGSDEGGGGSTVRDVDARGDVVVDQGGGSTTVERLRAANVRIRQRSTAR